jgi:hypothetical protein
MKKPSKIEYFSKIEEISGISGRWTNNNLDFTLFRHSPQLI